MILWEWRDHKLQLNQFKHPVTSLESRWIFNFWIHIGKGSEYIWKCGLISDPWFIYLFVFKLMSKIRVLKRIVPINMVAYVSHFICATNRLHSGNLKETVKYVCFIVILDSLVTHNFCILIKCSHRLTCCFESIMFTSSFDSMFVVPRGYAHTCN